MGAKYEVLLQESRENEENVCCLSYLSFLTQKDYWKAQAEMGLCFPVSESSVWKMPSAAVFGEVEKISRKSQ